VYFVPTKLSVSLCVFIAASPVLYHLGICDKKGIFFVEVAAATTRSCDELEMPHGAASHS
jgi:hypothetical protein